MLHLLPELPWLHRPVLSDKDLKTGQGSLVAPGAVQVVGSAPLMQEPQVRVRSPIALEPVQRRGKALRVARVAHALADAVVQRLGIELLHLSGPGRKVIVAQCNRGLNVEQPLCACPHILGAKRATP